LEKQNPIGDSRGSYAIKPSIAIEQVWEKCNGFGKGLVPVITTVLNYIGW